MRPPKLRPSTTALSCANTHTRTHTHFTSLHTRAQFKEFTFTKVLLKFSKIRKTINDVKQIFAAVDSDSDGSIDESEIKTCLQKLKSEIQLSELHDFFVVSAVSHTDSEKETVNKLNQKEFLVALCICYVLRAIPALSTPAARRSAASA